jgi:hypothetical protein
MYFPSFVDPDFNGITCGKAQQQTCSPAKKVTPRILLMRLGEEILDCIAESVGQFAPAMATARGGFSICLHGAIRL